MKKMWSGRFREPLDPEFEEWQRSFGFDVVTVAEGLENPWGLTFLPGGKMLVTERPGRLRVAVASGGRIVRRECGRRLVTAAQPGPHPGDELLRLSHDEHPAVGRYRGVAPPIRFGRTPGPEGAS